MDSTTGAATFLSGGRVRFDEKGRRMDAGMYFNQWQNGPPVLVFRSENAQAPVNWQLN